MMMMMMPFFFHYILDKGNIVNLHIMSTGHKQGRQQRWADERDDLMSSL